MNRRCGFSTTVLALAVSAILAGCFQAPEPGEPETPGSTGDRPAGVTTGAAQGLPAPTVPAPDPIGETDLGVPLYPGAALLQPQSSRKQGADSDAVTGVFTVADPPVIVAAYYRDYLLARARGAEILETPLPAGGVLLMLDEPGLETAVQVEVTPAGDGSRVKVMSIVFPIG